MELNVLPLETKLDRRFDMLEDMLDGLYGRFDDFEERITLAFERLEAVIAPHSAGKSR